MHAVTKTVVGGIVATFCLTVVMVVTPFMGMPKTDVGSMLDKVPGGSFTLAWVMHYVIGIVFAFGYLYLFNNLLKIKNNVLRGMLYGFIVFVFATLVAAGMGSAGLLPDPPLGSMVMTMLGNLLAHLVYGAVLGTFFNVTPAPLNPTVE